MRRRRRRISKVRRLIEIGGVVGRAVVHLLALRCRRCRPQSEVRIRCHRLTQQRQMRVVKRRVDMRQSTAIDVTMIIDLI